MVLLAAITIIGFGLIIWLIVDSTIAIVKGQD